MLLVKTAPSLVIIVPKSPPSAAAWGEELASSVRPVLDDGLTYYEYGLLDRVTSVKTHSVGYYEYTPGADWITIVTRWQFYGDYRDWSWVKTILT